MAKLLKKSTSGTKSKPLISKRSVKTAGRAKATKKTGKKTAKKTSKVTKTAKVTKKTAKTTKKTSKVAKKTAKTTKKTSKVAKKTAKTTKKTAKVAEKTAEKTAKKTAKVTKKSDTAPKLPPVRGLVGKQDTKAFFERTVRMDMRKRFDSVFEKVKSEKATAREEIKKRELNKARKRLSGMSKPALLKLLPIAERKIFRPVPETMIRRYLMQGVQRSIAAAERRYVKALERAGSVMTKKLVMAPINTAKEVERDILRLTGVMMPSPDWIIDPVPDLIAQYHSAKDSNEADAIAKTLADEMGLDLRSIYHMLHSPDAEDFV